MSEREPITAELRRVMNHTTMAGIPLVEIGEYEFTHRCDAIDAVHAGLERENAELRERLAALDNRRESMQISSATVTITPTLDWSGVARELQAIAATLGATDAKPTQVESSGTCEADETDTWECVRDDFGGYGKTLTVHVMECTECGHVYEHVNGDYEYCPRCGRRIEVNDG